ncbi:enoyl-CoA hydratase/isomerase family protein [Candidatus Phycosocius spiralis]|uniref:3-hydroxyisobutyryl-CoA hydrolase n=1 Tax=Candidatus Phycosocius spiralis TaxID=2815099 RepID=A0ABQ4PSD2_9PROT|nr:enoyl-CoA hydratase/isomerase family protein [Candidatus Phycosocius spiralis]GIU65886.1 enoyl-CoA hydratase [Candidatus Phycosocius spiralis]
MNPVEGHVVLVSQTGPLAILTLNRPEALHALNADMVAIMTQALLAWDKDPTVTGVLIDHAGPRGFCAGGDIKMLAESGATDGKQACAFFRSEYQLNHLLAHFEKPVIAVMDGISMGGGVGISVHGPIRICTEKTLFAMPETGIGLFPDVGGGWFLPRLPGEIGMWLALTGARLKAADCMLAGITTHYVPSDVLASLKVEITQALTAPEPVTALKACLKRNTQDPGSPQLLTPNVVDQINQCFGAQSVEDIVSALEAHKTPWADQQLAILQTKSPQTLKIALRQLREGRLATDFAQAMAQEFRIGARVVRRHDFQEGVRAVLVDKDHLPQWHPPTLAEVTSLIIDEIFAPFGVDEEQEWEPLTW